MKRISFNFGGILETVTDKPADMLEYAREQMKRVRQLLNDMPDYTCPSSCRECCHGSILMSYVEYINILQALCERFGVEKLAEIFNKRLGVLEEEGKLLCPFLQDDKEAEHCGIYQERPLICRVFGTTASPCAEDIDHPHFPEGPFYRAYNQLYYVEDGCFIGLPLTEGLALYEAPFDVWAIADSGRVEELMALFEQHGSMRAVICDLAEDTYFTILPGGIRKYLE